MFILKRISGGRNPEALRALYSLLLLKLFVNGYPLKKPSQTPLEYARPYPELHRFASIYTVLRYRERYAAGERERLWRDLRTSYDSLAHAVKGRGLGSALRRGFSLRGLGYRW
jgi:hypothetical protein